MLDEVAGFSYELSEAQYAANEREDTWVQRLLGMLVRFAHWLQPLTTGQVFDTIFCLVIDRVSDTLRSVCLIQANILIKYEQHHTAPFVVSADLLSWACCCRRA